MTCHVHGHAGRDGRSPTYNSWRAMRERCNNPRHPKYRDYGGRGIRVCDRWATFPVFLADMGERPAGTTLDRRDPNDHYYPDNCRWGTLIQQRWNRRTILRTDGVAWDEPPAVPPVHLFASADPIEELCPTAGPPF